MDILIFWVIISVIAIAVDIVTSNFFFVSFTFGGIIAIVVFILKGDIIMQFIVFGIVSLISMYGTYKISKKYLNKTLPKTLTMEENYIGREIVVTEDVIEKALCKIDGIYWTIKNVNEEIKKGDRVIITGIEGNKIIIKKKEK